MSQLEVKSLAFTLGITFSLLYLACIATMAILGEEIIITVFNSLLHGFDITTIIRMEVPIWESFIGLILTFIISSLVGALIAFTYNFLSTKN